MLFIFGYGYGFAVETHDPRQVFDSACIALLVTQSDTSLTSRLPSHAHAHTPTSTETSTATHRVAVSAADICTGAYTETTFALTDTYHKAVHSIAITNAYRPAARSAEQSRRTPTTSSPNVFQPAGWLHGLVRTRNNSMINKRGVFLNGGRASK